jgi:hypothetical protein
VLVPKRTQLRREKGWRMPPKSRSLARPHRWGNPFEIEPDLAPGTQIHAARTSRCQGAKRTIRRIRDEDMTPERREAARRKLRGKPLGCFCKPDEPCHADVLIEIANS